MLRLLSADFACPSTPAFVLAASIILNLFSHQTACAQASTAEQVQSVLKQHCVKCHGLSRREGGLRLSSRNEALLRNDSGEPAIVPFKPDQSLILNRIQSSDPAHRMPPDSAPLDNQTIELIRRWIEAGAEWSDSETSLSTHWSYIKPIRAEQSSPSSDTNSPDTNTSESMIDFWIRKKLAETRIADDLSPREQPARLLRRVYLDLIGVPPTPEEVEAFEANPDETQYAQVVDRLLASPHYGEKWATQWLDLARYADSNGYQADQFRTIWPYRDWVIQAMNSDMPFDQFTVEQLAGDLLPNASDPTRIATGFCRCTTCNVEAGVDPEENRSNQVADRVTTLGTVWLGTTLECARCHNHKYDPFTQQDFYQLYAFFNNTPLEVDPPKDGGVQYEVAGPVLLLNPMSDETPATAPATAPATTPGMNPKMTPVMTPVMTEMATPRKTHIFRRGDFLSPGPEVIPQMPAILSQQPLLSQEPLLSQQPESDPNRSNANQSNANQSNTERIRTMTRLDLARWLVHRDNPLTARVIVNRWWAAFFGRGLVETQEDFGTQGERPSHPELLDSLAVEFMESGWSMKQVHRQIVMSRTYQQTSIATPALREADPHNRLLARGSRFRLPAELIRDQALAVSGLLSAKAGGPPVYPPQPDGVWRHVGRNAPKYQTSVDEDRFRRGIYVVWRRSAPYPSFVNFDAPDRASCVAKRSTSNTPLQALTLLNDPAYVEMCHAFAQRILRDKPETDDEARIEYAFRLCVSRKPAARETATLIGLLQEQRSVFSSDPDRALQLMPESLRQDDMQLNEQAAWFSIANVLLNLDETISRN